MMPPKCHSDDYHKKLWRTIPRKDLQIIEDLLFLLFKHGDFSYTFFGIKPMCSIDYTLGYIKNFPENKIFVRETHQALKGFEVIKKYQHLFKKHSLQLLLRETKKCGGHFAFVLINRKKCLLIIEKHLDLFQKYYGKKHSPKKLLECLCQGKFFKDNKIDPIIFGLLLGYPEKDVHTFANQSSKKEKKTLRPFHLTSSTNPFTPIRSSFFMTNRTNKELKDIQLEYAREKKAIVELYYSPEFLETVLNKLML
jgi:hypothetical protein